VPRRNRVDPWGDLHAVPERGMFTGNRGCLVDDAGEVVRHHRSSTLWICCRTEFRDWKHPLAAPHVWTPIFFLDDAVALAAGHRPCATCRRDDYRSYRDAVTRALGRSEPLHAAELDRRLAAERLRRGRGLDRRADRQFWTADVNALPDGTVVVGDDGHPHLLLGGAMRPFGFGGWGSGTRARGTVHVLTPPTSVAAMRHGFVPMLHATASTG